MDIINLIMDALAAGVVAGTQDTASQMVRKSYDSLKQLIIHKISRITNQESAKKTLIEYERKPEEYKGALRKQLETAGVNKDDDVVKEAYKIIEIINQKKTDKPHIEIINHVDKIENQYNIGNIDKFYAK